MGGPESDGGDAPLPYLGTPSLSERTRPSPGKDLGPFNKDTVTRARATGWPALGESPRYLKSRKAGLGVQT